MSCNIKPNKTDYYVPNGHDFGDINVNQTILVKVDELKNADFLNYKEERHSNSKNKEWYPGVNSYYNHVEDVDPLNKVNYLLATPEILEKYFENRESERFSFDAYSEREAQIRYLKSNPVSFIILGKPDIGQQELGRQLAEYWKCVHIEPQTLVEEEIESGSRAGQCIEFNLRCGRAVSIDIILKLIEKKIKSDVARHRGFVISGVPVIPNNFYEEDPVSSESAIFTAKNIFEEVLDAVLGSRVASSNPQMSVVDNNEIKSVSELYNNKAPDMNAESNIQSSMPRQIDIGINYEKQLGFLFELLKPPYFIIYIYCGSIDVLNKRDSNRFHVQTNEMFNLQRQKYNKLYREIFVSDLEFNNGLLNTDITSIDDFRLKNLVKVPSDFKASVSCQLDYYHYTALNFIKSRVLVHNSEYLIRVDGRTTTRYMMNIVKSRLKIMNIQPVLIPNKLSDSELDTYYTTQETLLGAEDEEETKAQEEDKIITPNEYFKQLKTMNAPSNIFLWSWSDWGSKCPVSMKSGYIKEGSIKYAIQFMNKIFFLNNNDAYLRFYQNPRPYLLPPFPRTSCKIVIFGPKLSGRSALAQCLAYYFNGTVLSIAKIMKEYVDQIEDEFLEEVKRQAVAEAISTLNEQRKLEVEEKEKERIEQIKEWLKSVISLLEQMNDLLIEIGKEENKEQFEISSFPMQMKRIATSDALEDSELALTLTTLREEVNNLGLPIYKMDVPTWRSLITERKKLLQYLPTELSHKHVYKPATVHDEYVKDHVKESLAASGGGNIQISGGGILEMFLKYINAAAEKYQSQGLGSGGWIMDGMICNIEVLKEFSPHYLGDEVIVLSDLNDQHFLTQRFEHCGNTYFNDYRSFFYKMGYEDAIWRSPSVLSTETSRKSFIRTILDDILDADQFYTNPESNNTDDKPRVEEYKQDLNQFHQEWKKIKEFYLERNITPIEISVSNKTLPDLFEDVIREIENRYKVRPYRSEQQTKMEEKMEQEEIKDQADAEDTTLVETKVDERSEETRRYGELWYYCPVTFREKWVLWKGKNEFAAKYNDHDYLLATEDDIKKFLHEPARFLPSQPEKCPPPRICIVGVTGCGKTTLAKEISNNYGLIYVSFEQFLKECFKIKTSETFNELKANKNRNLYSYLNGDSPLTEEIIALFHKYWFKEPFRSKGFVIDDFPKTPYDIEFMVRDRLIPDIILYASSSEAYLKTKFIDRALKSWQESVDKHRQEVELRHSHALEKWREDRTVKFNVLIEERREKRYAKKIQDKIKEMGGDDASQVSFDSVAEQKDIEEVNKLVDSEFPPLEFDVPVENPEVFISKTEPLLFNRIQTDLVMIKKIQEKCIPEMIPFQEIELNLDNFNKTVISSFLLIHPLKFRNESHLECCYQVTPELADRLLSSGYYFLSKFGKTCPVQYYNNKDPIQLYSIAEERNILFPVIHKSYIYFLVGHENKTKFIGNPLKYINKEFRFPLLPLRVGVTGPPKCGKTTLAKRIQEKYGFKLITRGQAVRYVLKYLSQCDLANNMEDVLRKGWELTDEMVIKSVEAACFDKKSATLGVVFDGFPNSLNEVKHLSFLDLLPNIIIDLEANLDEVSLCLASDIPKSFLPKYGLSFVSRLYDKWNEEADNFRQWFDREYQAMAKIRINPSKWYLFNESQGYLETAFWEIKHYHQHITEGWPLRLGNMLITPLEFLERQSTFKQYCPLCLHYSNSLTSGGEPPDRTGLIQFGFSIYWVCQEHTEAFLKSPEIYLPPYNYHSMPATLAKVMRCDRMPVNVYEDGACAVCYKTQRIITKGKLNFAALYNEKIYLFDATECMNIFLKTPQQFLFGIEFRAPVYPELKYNDLPILGMLEQYVAKYIVQGISFVAKKRPIIPGLGISESALIGLGLFIKVKNENIDARLKPFYDDGFVAYNDRRDKLLNHLETMKTYRNPYLHYEDTLPEFKLPPSVKSQSLTTMVSRIVDECVDNIDVYLHNAYDETI